MFVCEQIKMDQVQIWCCWSIAMEFRCNGHQTTFSTGGDSRALKTDKTQARDANEPDIVKIQQEEIIQLRKRIAQLENERVDVEYSLMKKDEFIHELNENIMDLENDNENLELAKLKQDLRLNKLWYNWWYQYW